MGRPKLNLELLQVGFAPGTFARIDKLMGGRLRRGAFIRREVELALRRYEREARRLERIARGESALDEADGVAGGDD
jgi:hypothetical protein